MTIQVEDIKVMYQEETGRGVELESEKQPYIKWLERKYLSVLRHKYKNTNIEEKYKVYTPPNFTP